MKSTTRSRDIPAIHNNTPAIVINPDPINFA